MSNHASPLISICCLSFNHAVFLRQCLEGFLSQQTEYSYEILIHDDCSTDGTIEIIKEYSQKYPDIIFPIFELENQYSKGKASTIDFYNYKRARGKYIAYCEGDDYWTDPYKLQKQVSFLEDHPEYSVCFHMTSIYEVETGILRPMCYNFPGGNDGIDIDVTPELFLNSSIGQPLSMVFRKDIYSFEWANHYTYFCDTVELYHILRTGKGRFMKFIGGQYNLHSGGVSATQRDVDRSIRAYNMSLEMLSYTGDSNLINYARKLACWCDEMTAINGKVKAYNKLLIKTIIKIPNLGYKVLADTIKHRIKRIIAKP